jgi:hypothetical protein
LAAEANRLPLAAAGDVISGELVEIESEATQTGLA